MSNASQNLPDDPAFLKAMIAALQAENAKMSATLQAHDQLIGELRLRIAKLKKQVFGKSSGKDRTGNPAAGTGAGGSFNRRSGKQHQAAR
ncbi:hypothetical protein ACVMB3_004233 [Sinorhizobium meliloti]